MYRRLEEITPLVTSRKILHIYVVSKRLKILQYIHQRR